jgi:hypothetical protein
MPFPGNDLGDLMLDHFHLSLVRRAENTDNVMYAIDCYQPLVDQP